MQFYLLGVYGEFIGVTENHLTNVKLIIMI